MRAIKVQWRFILRAACVWAASCAMAISGAHAAATAEEVGADLAKRNDAVVAALRRLRAEDALTAAAALDLIRREISPIMNFRLLAGSATGKYWRRASDAEKDEITAAFQDLLEGVYAKVLARYGDQKVRLVESKLRADDAVLVAVEVRGDGQSALMEYVFRDAGGAMKIADVLVEKVSLLDTYRRQFAQIAKKDGVAGLAAKLREIASR